MTKLHLGFVAGLLVSACVSPDPSPQDCRKMDGDQTWPDHGHAEHPTILLEADSSDLGKRALGLDRIMLERLGGALEAEGIDTSGSIFDLGVRVRVIPVNMRSFHYSILFEFAEDDTYTRVLDAVDCKPCIDATPLEKIDARAPALADLIKVRPGEGTAGEDTNGKNNDPKPIGPLGCVGLGVSGRL